MALHVGDNVRWHRPQPGTPYPAFLADGSVGWVYALVPGDPTVTVKFEVYDLLDVHINDLTPYCPADLTRPEEVEAWLSS